MSSKHFGFDMIPLRDHAVRAGYPNCPPHFGRERLLKKKIEPIRRKYQVIIIDCPPSLGLITVNALMASRDHHHSDLSRVFFSQRH